jgi:hypothetical protein
VRWGAVPLREDAGCSVLHALTQVSALRGALSFLGALKHLLSRDIR